MIRASLYGISKLQNGSGKGGFLGGFAASLLGGVVSSVQNASTPVKVAMSAIAGGTASVLGGGKFSNGAMSGAFIMMFNDLKGTLAEKIKDMAVDASFKKALEMNGVNKPMQNILIDGAMYSGQGAILGAVLLESTISGAVSGGIIGFGAGLIIGVSAEAFGYNALQSSMMDSVIRYDYIESTSNIIDNLTNNLTRY